MFSLSKESLSTKFGIRTIERMARWSSSNMADYIVGGPLN